MGFGDGSDRGPGEPHDDVGVRIDFTWIADVIAYWWRQMLDEDFDHP